MQLVLFRGGNGKPRQIREYEERKAVIDLWTEVPMLPISFILPPNSQAQNPVITMPVPEVGSLISYQGIVYKTGVPTYVFWAINNGAVAGVQQVNIPLTPA